MYSRAINPLASERYWPKMDLPIQPPLIKVGPGRPRKNRIKDPFEQPKKLGKLIKHGVEMSCNICKSKSHNKRKCLEKDKQVEPQPKKGRGRPKKTPQLTTNSNQDSSTVHQVATMQPSRIGRGGRVVKTSTGRGSSASAGRGKGRSDGRDKGRGRDKNTTGLTIGFGVLVDNHGNTFINEPGSGGPKMVFQLSNTKIVGGTQSSIIAS